MFSFNFRITAVAVALVLLEKPLAAFVNRLNKHFHSKNFPVCGDAFSNPIFAVNPEGSHLSEWGNIWSSGCMENSHTAPQRTKMDTESQPSSPQTGQRRALRRISFLARDFAVAYAASSAGLPLIADQLRSSSGMPLRGDTSRVLSLYSARGGEAPKVVDGGLLKLPECADSIVVLKGRSAVPTAAGGSGREVVLIGTAHISEDSVQQVRRVINTVQPEVVMIELDVKRVGKVADGETLEDLGFILPKQAQISAAVTPLSSSGGPGVAGGGGGDMRPKERSNFVTGLLTSVRESIVSNAQKLAGAVLGKALSEFYTSIEKLGFTAGGEFKAAVEEARNVGAKILLGDRDVDVTLSRLASALSDADPDKFAGLLDQLTTMEEKMGFAPSKEGDLTKEELSVFVEGIKKRETITNLMNVLQKELPDVYSALVGERDAYMAASILGSEGEGSKLVAVVGLAHISGIERNLVQSGSYSVVKRNCPPSS